MSTRESGSDTWPRFAEFPQDNLDLGNAPEEDDVDHDSEPSSWRTGSAAVGTGAGPPDLDEETESDREDRPYPADVGKPADTTAAPGFSDVPDAGFGDAGGSGPAFGEDHGFGEGPAFGEDHGFGEAPAASPGFTAAPDTDAFGAAPASAGFGGQAESGPGFQHPGFDSQGFEGTGFSNGQHGYAGDYQGEYAGAYQGAGFGAAPPGGSFAGAAPAYGGPAAGPGYV